MKGCLSMSSTLINQHTPPMTSCELKQYLFDMALYSIPSGQLTSSIIQWIYIEHLKSLSRMLFKKDSSLNEIERKYETYHQFIIKYPLLKKHTLYSNELVNNSSSNYFDQHGWEWRYNMSVKIARNIQRSYFGIKGIYLFGSTNNMTATRGSDIDILIYIAEDKPHFMELEAYLSKWDQILSDINFIHNGIKSPYMLDIHYVTDHDRANHTSYATLITSQDTPVTVL